MMMLTPSTSNILVKVPDSPDAEDFLSVILSFFAS